MFHRPNAFAAIRADETGNLLVPNLRDGVGEVGKGLGELGAIWAGEVVALSGFEGGVDDLIAVLSQLIQDLLVEAPHSDRQQGDQLETRRLLPGQNYEVNWLLHEEQMGVGA